MADNPNATATDPATPATDPNAQPGSPEATAEATPKGDAAPETTEGALSPELAKTYELLQDQPDFFDDTAEPETEEEPEPIAEAEPEKPKRRGDKTASEEVAAGPFDTAALVKEMVEEVGAGAEPIAKRVGGAINTLMAQVEDLNERLNTALDENKRLIEGIEPVKKNVERWTKAEERMQLQAQAREQGEAAEFFNSQKEYADRYGSKDSRSEVTDRWRMTIYSRAQELREIAKRSNMNLSVKEACQMAQFERFKGKVTPAGATKAVQDKVQRGGRGLSVDPARTGGGKGGQAKATPEQAREERIKVAADIFAGAGRK